MKKSGIVVLGILVFMCAGAGLTFGQYMPKPSIIGSYNIGVTTTKTTVLLFPYSIKSIDRGSPDILVQKAPGTENVLQVKAAKANFEQTNLSVITGDGLLYSFIVDFVKTPADLNFSFTTSVMQPVTAEVAGHPVLLEAGSLTEKQLQIYSKEVLSLKNSIHGVKDYSYDIFMKIEGIYVKNDRMFFKVLFKNLSDIDYDIDELRFFVRDQKRIKRTASQEIEMKPIYAYEEPSTIKGESRKTCVIVLPKFTIPDKKYFTIEMSEKNGGRFLRVIIKNKKLMKCVVI